MALHNGGWQAFDDDYSGYFVEDDDANIVAVFQAETDADEYVNLRQRVEKAEAERNELDAALKTTGERGWYVEYKQLLERVKELDAQAATQQLEGVATHIDMIHAYAAYYAEVTAQGDAPETFVNWFHGAR